MALAYITLPEIQNFLGITGQDTLLTVLGETAESMFNQLIGSSTGLTSGAKTEYHDDLDMQKGNCGRVFYLKTYNPTVITTINGVSPGTANVNYTLVGRRLEMAIPVSLPSAFPYRYTIVYTSGITTITNDIKTACLYLLKGLWDNRKGMDIASFSQDALSVTYKGDKFIDMIVDPSEQSFVRLIMNKYKIPYFYAT